MTDYYAEMYELQNLQPEKRKMTRMLSTEMLWRLSNPINLSPYGGDYRSLCEKRIECKELWEDWVDKLEHLEPEEVFYEALIEMMTQMFHGELLFDKDSHLDSHLLRYLPLEALTDLPFKRTKQRTIADNQLDFFLDVYRHTTEIFADETSKMWRVEQRFWFFCDLWWAAKSALFRYYGREDRDAVVTQALLTELIGNSENQFKGWMLYHATGSEEGLVFKDGIWRAVFVGKDTWEDYLNYCVLAM